MTIENIDRYLEKGMKLHEAIIEGASQIAVPAFVSSLCICIVFVPMFLLSRGRPVSLHIPLAESVVLAVMASYVLSRTLVPTLAMYLLKDHAHKQSGAGEKNGENKKEDDEKSEPSLNDEHSGETPGFFWLVHHKFDMGFHRCPGSGYAGLLGRALDHRGLFALVFLALCGASMCLVPFLGQDFFPTVDAGQFKLHIRTKTGTRIEETAKLCDQIEAAIPCYNIPAKPTSVEFWTTSACPTAASTSPIPIPV